MRVLSQRQERRPYHVTDQRDHNVYAAIFSFPNFRWKNIHGTKCFNTSRLSPSHWPETPQAKVCTLPIIHHCILHLLTTSPCGSNETWYKISQDRGRFHQVTTTPASKNEKPQHTLLPTNPSITYRWGTFLHTVILQHLEAGLNIEGKLV